MGEGNKPIATVKGYGAYGLQIAVWPGHDGQASFTITKRYKDKETQEWKESKSLFMSELIALLAMIPEAASYANEYSERKYQEKKAGNQFADLKTADEIANIPDFNDEEIPF